MVEWPELGGAELEFRDRWWELTGRVDVRGTGESLAVEARDRDDVRHETVDLRFRVEDPPASLNPGDIGEHFDRLEREGDRYVLFVEKGSRVYRYGLRGIER